MPARHVAANTVDLHTANGKLFNSCQMSVVLNTNLNIKLSFRFIISMCHSDNLNTNFIRIKLMVNENTNFH
jgi:hypothetical protein